MIDFVDLDSQKSQYLTLANICTLNVQCTVNNAILNKFYYNEVGLNKINSETA